MTFIHKNLALDRWQRFSLSEQLANIGSEVSRADHWRKRGDLESEKKSISRALELIDLTIADKRWRGRLFEIIRLREVICDFFFGKNSYNTSFLNIENYFLQFATRHFTVSK